MKGWVEVRGRWGSRQLGAECALGIQLCAGHMSVQLREAGVHRELTRRAQLMRSSSLVTTYSPRLRGSAAGLGTVAVALGTAGWVLSTGDTSRGGHQPCSAPGRQGWPPCTPAWRTWPKGKDKDSHRNSPGVTLGEARIRRGIQDGHHGRNGDTGVGLRPSGQAVAGLSGQGHSMEPSRHHQSPPVQAAGGRQGKGCVHSLLRPASPAGALAGQALMDASCLHGYTHTGAAQEMSEGQ